LVPHIRYPLISGPDLVNVVKPCKVAPEDLYVAALEFVNAPEHITPNGLQYKERSGESRFEKKNNILVTSHGHLTVLRV
jgi:hypothetical protein